MSHATRGEYTITTGSHAQDLEAIHGFLTNSYWSPGVPIEVVERAIANSLCFGLFRGKDQVGFARVITDKATFAYLADVYVLESTKTCRVCGGSCWRHEMRTVSMRNSGSLRWPIRHG